MFGLRFSDDPISCVDQTDCAQLEPASADKVNPQSAGSALTAFLPWAVSLLFHVVLVSVVILLVVFWVQEALPKQKAIITAAGFEKAPQQTKPKSTKPDLLLATPDQSLGGHSFVAGSDYLTPSPHAPIKPASLTTSQAGTPAFKGLPDGLDQDEHRDSDLVSDRSSDRAPGFFVVPSIASVQQVVYVIDASGSLIDTLPFVICRLQDSIIQLSPNQSFTVIFFQGDRAIEVPPFGMKTATQEIKQRVFEWMDTSAGNIVPAGKTNPLNALTKALMYQPDLIYLLSDNITGQGPDEIDRRYLLAEIQQANLRQTKICTIQFLYPDPLERFGLTPTMQLISQTTGGQYKYVDGRDLGLQ